MRFDYLRSSRALFVQRLLEVRVPQRLHNALLALLGSVVIIAGAWSIDAYRLRGALAVEAVYEQRYDEVAERLKQTHLYYDRVKALVELDRRIRSIAASGDADARTLAEIANRLPPHAWLTSISHDDGGLALEGRAKDFRVIGAVMRGLMHAEHVRRPTLVSATLDDLHGRDAAVKYEIHVDGAAP